MVAIFIYKEIICRFGISQILQSNKKTYFLNEIIKKLTEKFRIKHNLFSLYHIQSNGLVERFNKNLYQDFAKVTESIYDWDIYI